MPQQVADVRADPEVVELARIDRDSHVATDFTGFGLLL
jgi:hypothetical protein